MTRLILHSVAFVLVIAGVPALASPQTTPEATSLLGKPLFSPAPAEAARARMEADLAGARDALAKSPNDADALIWVGRRTAYLGRYREAIRIFSDGVAKFPNDARFLRHRGHRYITVREFDRAIADLGRARTLVAGKPDQIEPDGQPNARNVPLTTLGSNIRYHLALAYYLKGDFAKAEPVWREAADSVGNADNLVSATHWLYLTLRRLGRRADADKALARITTDLEVIENMSYHSLLLLYRGDRTEAAVLNAAGEGAAGSAVRYGVSAWHAVNGRHSEAERMWRELVALPEWAPFGVIAAEAELTRPGRSGSRTRSR